MSENRNSFIEATKATDERLEALKQLYPELFADGKLNIDVLKEITGGENPQEDRTPGYYGLYWPGKRKAKIEAKASPKGTLVPVPGDGVNEDSTHNIYIEGDNLEVLRILKQSYKGRVKMIYIDPPYNTGNDFIYPDDYTMPVEEYKRLTGQTDEKGNALTTNQKSNGAFHTNWLNMMLPRLMLARELLTEDGVIFISIDDNEQANLKLLCDDVFGEENFIGELSVENNPKGRKNSDFISVSSEYCIIYARNKDNCYFVENIPKKSSDMSLDENGRYVHNSGKRVLVGENKFNDYVTNPASDKNYSVYFSKKDGKIQLVKEEYGVENSSLIDKGYKKYFTHNKGKLVENTYTEQKFKQLFEDKALEITEDKIYEKNFSDTIRIKSQLVNKEYEAIVNGEKRIFSLELTTTGANTYLKDLFETEETPFSAAKNVGFIRTLLSLRKDENAIVMDFFSGSSTSADAIMRLNSNDSLHRKFIMIQLPENLDERLKKASVLEKKTVETAIDYLNSKKKKHNLCELAKERIRRAGAKILKETNANKDMFSEDNSLDVGFKVYRMQESNFKEYTPVQGQDENATKSLFEELENNQIPLVDGWKTENVLTEIILKQGFALDCDCKKVNSFTQNTVYCIKDSEGPASRTTTMYVCLDTQIDSDTIKNLKLDEKEKFVCLNSAIDDTSYARLADKGRIETI